jgi:hypothetical protein
MCRLRLFFRRASLQYKSDKVRRQLPQYYCFTAIIHKSQGHRLLCCDDDNTRSGISIITGVSSVSSAHGQDKASVAGDHVGITAKSVLLLYLRGAPRQIDTFDMKLDALDQI